MNIDRAQIQAIGDRRADPDPSHVQAIDHDAIKAMVSEGRTINAIHHVRDVLKIGLFEAKERVEEIMGRPVGQRLPPAGVKITHTAILPDGKVEFGCTMDRQPDPVTANRPGQSYVPTIDPADYLHNVLSNLGLYDGWDAEYAKHRGKAEPEIATGIALIRAAINEIGQESDRYQIQAETATAERDRLQAILDAERGVKGLDGWVYSQDTSTWVLPTGATAGPPHATVHSRCASKFWVHDRTGRITTIHVYTCTDALDGMERAINILRSKNLIP